MTNSCNSVIVYSYWLKCWKETSLHGQGDVWRYSLQNPDTGERFGFVSLGSMASFLEKELNQLASRHEAEEEDA